MIILASASPRRAELLRAAGIAFEVRPADVDESVRPGEQPVEYVRRVAAAKADAMVSRSGGRPVLAADTVVVAEAEILGKPADREDAVRMLRLLSGRTHEVLTGVALRVGTSAPVVGVERTRVQFAPLGDNEIAWYVASAEPMDKAGAYAIQGLASRFVLSIDGSYSNVVGLPVALVYRMLREAGFAI